MKIANENSLSMALKTGINIFAGAGFSILAKDKQDRTLPLASNLLAELNNP